jgi:hypothetical protein
VNCEATMESREEQNHKHSCDGKHEVGGDHFCPVCLRWWWVTVSES